MERTKLEITARKIARWLGRCSGLCSSRLPDFTLRKNNKPVKGMEDPRQHSEWQELCQKM